ncbi:protein FAR1-RELATED SEQUENCE 5-like [Phragmites australis]|uniref:protein FAR1-RELATED SEQUENCE 5-like n=1 Tax=Phragmites australis TaxID=29695 RepID=UPI002D776E9C|nr:protein FAR1-RELATED SEQUENCE 5-like [Phragmites australis]
MEYTPECNWGKTRWILHHSTAGCDGEDHAEGLSMEIVAQCRANGGQNTAEVQHSASACGAVIRIDAGDGKTLETLDEDTPPATDVLNLVYRKDISNLGMRLLSLNDDWTEGVPEEILDTTQPIERVVLEEIDQNAELPENYSDPEIFVPRVGQGFKTDTDAFNFYNMYSIRMGFGIRHNKNRKNVAGEKTMQEMCCTHQGHNSKTKKPSVRLGCPAMVRVNRSNGDDVWTLTKFVTEHNHSMKGRTGVTMNYQSHNRIDEGTRGIVADMVDSGIKSTNMYGLLAGLHGGPSMVPFNRRAMDRLAYAIKRDECSDDVQKTLDFFRENEAKSKNFFYSVQVDKACRVKNIFWAHAVSRLNFELFGDVVTFDTTYRTNKYEMPFAPFVGVNNHYQSTIFGGALLREETIESFKWLFGTFKKCMNGKEPKSILTDNCRAMEVAIGEVFPNTSHRVCKWHVLKKAKERLGNIYSGKRSPFKEEFHKVLNQSLTVEEFEYAWSELMSRYGLRESVYLNQIWDIKEKWAFVYFAEYFFAGMTTTQRSESANHVFKKFIGPSCIMFGFVKGYERFLQDRLQVEDTEEFHTENEKVDNKTNSPIEKHAARIYTRGVFNLFSEQLVDSLSFKLEPSETEKVMFQYGISEIPDRYILKRWTKNARDYIPSHLQGYKDDEDAAASRTYRHSMLSRLSMELARRGNKDVETYRKTMDAMSQLLDDLKIGESSQDDDSGQNWKL